MNESGVSLSFGRPSVENNSKTYAPVLLEDSIEYKKASRRRREGAHAKAFARPKSFQTAVFLDWSRCWKSGSLLCVYPPDDRRRRRPLNECTKPNIENNDTNEEKRTGCRQSEKRERERERERDGEKNCSFFWGDFLKRPSRESRQQNWNPFEKFVT